ncbi:MAG: ribosome maturation factor RimP [Eubacteriales bacterium]|nr:ribosome maturation factor RimP [Eubacteriales bacterium]
MILKDGQNKTEKLIEGIGGSFLEENGLELYYADFRKEGQEWFLMVFIDISEEVRNEHPDEDMYIDSGDCEKFSRYLSDKLDEKDPFSQKYTLVVSSPGLDRQLYARKDFQRFTGSGVDVKLYKKLDGSKMINGTLKSFDDKGIVLEYDGKETEIDFNDIVKVSLEVLF